MILSCPTLEQYRRTQCFYVQLLGFKVIERSPSSVWLHLFTPVATSHTELALQIQCHHQHTAGDKEEVAEPWGLVAAIDGPWLVKDLPANAVSSDGSSSSSASSSFHLGLYLAHLEVTKNNRGHCFPLTCGSCGYSPWNDPWHRCNIRSIVWWPRMNRWNYVRAIHC